MSETETLLAQSNSACADHRCPKCGVPDHVTAECVLMGTTTVTLCHCRMCGHSWHAHIEPVPIV